MRFVLLYCPMISQIFAEIAPHIAVLSALICMVCRKNRTIHNFIIIRINSNQVPFIIFIKLQFFLFCQVADFNESNLDDPFRLKSG